MTVAVRVRRALGTHWYAWTMVAPVVLVIGVIIGYPLVRGVFLSLTDANEANVQRDIGVNHIPATYKFTGLDNYQAVLSDSVFWTVWAGRSCGPSAVSRSPSWPA